MTERRRSTSPWGRRSFLRVATAAAAALALPGSIGERASAGEPASRKARRCVLLWMNGGPSHVDTFDPKPALSTPFKSIPTRIPDVRISEHLPALADMADELCICRSMTSREGNHARAQYLAHTGYAPNPTVLHPSMGAWVQRSIASPPSTLPPFISLGGPSHGGGILGASYDPFVVSDPGQMPENVHRPANVGPERFARRQRLLAELETSFVRRGGGALAAERGALYERAYALMSAPEGAAFELTDEPDALRAAYGDTPFGRGCLTARRLLESGVVFVEVVLDGWDTHRDHFERTRELMRALDPAMATLIRDLRDRRMLDDTLVVWMGEFGRTPRLNGNEGRDHHPDAWTAVLAGAGVRRGTAYGETDERGQTVTKGAVTIPDLMATIATQLGIDPMLSVPSPLGRPISVTDSGTPVAGLVQPG